MKKGMAIFGVCTRSSRMPALTLPIRPAMADRDTASVATPICRPRSVSRATVWARTPPTTREWITRAAMIIQ